MSNFVLYEFELTIVHRAATLLSLRSGPGREEAYAQSDSPDY
jgi:hypothetical protein